jgi:hypothetical protein
VDEKKCWGKISKKIKTSVSNQGFAVLLQASWFWMEKIKFNRDLKKGNL